MLLQIVKDNFLSNPFNNFEAEINGRSHDILDTDSFPNAHTVTRQTLADIIFILSFRTVSKSPEYWRPEHWQISGVQEYK
jgi:hypothetical protein